MYWTRSRSCIALIAAGALAAVPAERAATAAHVSSPATQASASSTPSTIVTPTFQNFAAPAPLGTNAGEPSIGINVQSGKALFQSGTNTLSVTFNDSASPSSASWSDVSAPGAVIGLDPILFTDQRTGRTFESQLTGQDSLTEFTDNDGGTGMLTDWTPSQGGGIPSGVDHQSIGGGPYSKSGIGGPLTAYPDAVYYCSQELATAFCARSDNGGLTFGAGVPVYNLTQCGGLHGHVKVAPDGTVYLPNAHCYTDPNSTQPSPAVAVSTDNGVNWTIRGIPGAYSSTSGSDPSVGIGANGTIYVGYQDVSGHPKVAVSHDRGVTWSTPFDAGAPFNIANSSFPEVVAGDDNRAAYAFLGTTTGGNDQDPAFPGTWYLYVAYTYDGGGTWTTVNATPNDPVQRGCIWHGGGSNQCRNLLDFNDITIDQKGRVLVGYADGCVAACVTNSSANTYASVATIARQSGGTGLYAAF